MSVSEQVPPEAADTATMPTTATSTSPPASTFEQCDQCGAPVEQNQRYCVVCGGRRRHVHDPAARYLATSTSRSRTSTERRQARSGPRSSGLAVALVVAVIPLAVGLGVLVGRASNGGDAKLIAALKAQKPEIINTGGSSSGVSTDTAQTTPLSSSFPLQQGYSVELQTLPASGTDQSTVSAAEAAARAKGAQSVGLITPQGFSVKPSPPSGDYVIYSGAFTTRASAEKALSRLNKHFHSALVIQVKSATATGATAGGKVLSKTSYGTATQITGFHATKSQLNAGKQVVTHIQQTEGKSYVQAQQGLPSQISIP